MHKVQFMYFNTIHGEANSFRVAAAYTTYTFPNAIEKETNQHE